MVTTRLTLGPSLVPNILSFSQDLAPEVSQVLAEIDAGPSSVPMLDSGHVMRSARYRNTLRPTPTTGGSAGQQLLT